MKNKYYPHLFEKGKIGNVVIKNRIVRNSMGTYLGNPDGQSLIDKLKLMHKLLMVVQGLFLWIMLCLCQ